MNRADEVIGRLQARIAELERFEFAYSEWHDKTEWVQAEVSAGVIGFRALGRHRADVITGLVSGLRAEIVKRDARIAEQEREIDANCMREAREIGILKRECDRLRNELAAMITRPRIVLLPERGNENEGNSYSAMQAIARNQALDEVARLNPCRAQAVADGFAKEIARIADDYHASNIEDADVALDEMREALNSALSALAAAPSAQQKESE